jgi:uncharacterized protein YdeI (YjbR/CyaY-like superfamily)
MINAIPPELNIIRPKSSRAWRQWLAKNHHKDETVWVTCSKKQAAKPTLSRPEAVAEALCYGWIDGTVRSLDAEYFIQSFTKRRSKSMWCKANKEKVVELIAEGLMMQPGLDAIEAAKQNGYWSILDDGEALKVPADLRQALKRDLTAHGFFHSLCNSDRKRLIHWIALAKRPETKAKRIADIVASTSREQKPKLLAR